MSTRSLIGQKREDGIHYFYCHFDGYPEGVGAELIKHYDSEELVTKLVDLCEPYGISSLESTLKGTKCERYINDPSCYEPVKTKKDYVKNAAFDIEYIYLWDRGEWQIFNISSPTLYDEKIEKNIKNGRFKIMKKYCKRALK